MYIKTLAQVAVLLTYCFTTTYAVCSEEIKNKLLALWGGSIPEEIVENWMTNKLTTVWMSPVLAVTMPGVHIGNALEGLACLTTTVDKVDGMTVNDYWYFENKTSLTVEYSVSMETPGIVTVLEENFTDQRLQVVFIQDGVYAMYACDSDPSDESWKPGVIIKVLNYDASNANQQVALGLAKTLLSSLGFNDGVAVSTDCPTMLCC